MCNVRAYFVQLIKSIHTTHWHSLFLNSALVIRGQQRGNGMMILIDLNRKQRERELNIDKMMYARVHHTHDVHPKHNHMPLSVWDQLFWLFLPYYFFLWTHIYMDRKFFGWLNAHVRRTHACSYKRTHHCIFNWINYFNYFSWNENGALKSISGWQFSQKKISRKTRWRW